MERGKAAMMTALAGIVLALVAYGVVELVMDAVVGNAGGPHRARPELLRHHGQLATTARRDEMREHEVPTHVQAEDKVLLWFTFPQIVAVVAVCALSYGAYHYLPFGPMAVRLAVGVLIGIVGIALIVGKIGGRVCPW